eukprot:COSAG04_NODE_549_length_12731_cov_52.636479_2_plen_881_part_00
MLSCCKRRVRTGVDVDAAAGSAAPMRGDPQRAQQREHEFNAQPAAAAVDTVDNPLAPAPQPPGDEPSDGSSSDESSDPELLPPLPVVLIPARGRCCAGPPVAWERGLSDQARRMAAFELLLQSVPEGGDELAGLTDTVRVHLEISRRQCRKMQQLLRGTWGYNPLLALRSGLQPAAAAAADAGHPADRHDVLAWQERQVAVVAASACWSAYWATDQHQPGAEPPAAALEAASERYEAIQAAAARLSADTAGGLAALASAAHRGDALPYPVAQQLHITLLLAAFEPPGTGPWGLVHESDEILGLLRCCWPAVGVAGEGDPLHQLSWIRAAFIVFLQAEHAKADTSGVLAIVAEAVRAYLSAISARPRYERFEEIEYESAVLPGLVAELEDRLSDYHARLPDPDTIAQMESIYSSVRHAHIADAKEARSARKRSAKRFVKDSVRSFYRRLGEALVVDVGGADGAAGAAAEESVAGGLVDLADCLAEDGLLAVVSPAVGLAAAVPNAAQLALRELLQCFSVDVAALVAAHAEAFSAVGPEVLELLRAVHVLVESAAELLGESACLDALHRQIVASLAGAISGELLQQRRNFDGMVRRCKEAEDWAGAGEDAGNVSSATIDLFAMVGQTLPLMLGSGLLIGGSAGTHLAETYVGNISSCVMEWALWVGERGRAAAEEGGLAPACVRLNSLIFGRAKIVSVADQLQDNAFVMDDAAQADDGLFAGSFEVLDVVVREAAERVALLAARGLRPALEALWAPTPAESRIDALLDELDDGVAGLFPLLPDEGTFKRVLVLVLDGLTGALAGCLRQGGPQRKFRLDDGATFLEDVEALERWFVARDARGEVQGLADDVVEQRTLALHRIVDLGQTKSGGASERRPGRSAA